VISLMRLMLVVFFCAQLSTCAVASNQSNLAIGRQAYKEGNFAKATFYLTPLAEGGDPEASVLVGKMYYWGDGVTRSSEKAEAYYRQAATSGNGEASYLLGLLQLQRNSLTEARDLFETAVNGGFVLAKFEVGTLLSSGPKEYRDYCKAVALFNEIAADYDLAREAATRLAKSPEASECQKLKAPAIGKKQNVQKFPVSNSEHGHQSRWSLPCN